MDNNISSFCENNTAINLFLLIQKRIHKYFKCILQCYNDENFYLNFSIKKLNTRKVTTCYKYNYTETALKDILIMYNDDIIGAWLLYMWLALIYFNYSCSQ